MNDLSWLLVATRSRNEFIARQHLERQGFQVCLPLVNLRKRKQGKWQAITEPLFPGYVFLGVKLGEQDIALIGSTRGCRELVSFGGQLVPIPAEVLQQFSDYDKVPVEISQSFKKGQRVRIEDGSFVGVDGVFEQIIGVERVQILLEVLGAERSVTIPADSIGTL